MKLVAKCAIAAVAVTAIAAPAMAGQWVYHGGPKSPDSMTWYEPDSYGYYAPDRDSGPYYGGPRYMVPDDD